MKWQELAELRPSRLSAFGRTILSEAAVQHTNEAAVARRSLRPTPNSDASRRGAVRVSPALIEHEYRGRQADILNELPALMS